MKILISGKEQKGWKVAEPHKSEAELELQKLLMESPSLIPVDGIRERDQIRVEVM